MSSLSIPITPETEELLRKQLALFEAKFGRPAGPNDTVFFDPGLDAPTPQLEKLADFIPGERRVVMMIVGVKDTRAGRMKKISRSISRTFLSGAQIKPYRIFGERVTYLIGAFTDFDEQGFQEFLREVVSIRGVDWLDLCVNFNGKDYYFSCEGADDIRLVEGLKASSM